MENSENEKPESEKKSFKEKFKKPLQQGILSELLREEYPAFCIIILLGVQVEHVP